MPRGDHPAPEHVMRLGLGFRGSKILLSAAEMGLLTEFSRHHRRDAERIETRWHAVLRCALRGPRRLGEFLAAMTVIGRAANLQVAERFPWDERATFADAGTAQGFDLPKVARAIEDYVVRNGLSGRLGFTPGNFFTGPRPRADVITMEHIPHDRNLDEKRMPIAKAYEALPDGGALIGYEPITGPDSMVIGIR